MITRIRLQNWRNFREADVALGSRAFIVGPNASGKSNFIDAIRFLRDVANPSGGLQRAIEQRGGLSKIRCLAARRDPVVQLSIEIEDPQRRERWTYEIGIRQQPRGHRETELAFERVYLAGKLILERPDVGDKRDPLRLTQTHLEQISANVKFRFIATFLEEIRYLHLVPQLLRYPELGSKAIGHEDPFGRNFLENIAKTPEKTRRARLQRIEKALREAVPQLQHLTDVKDEAGVPHLEAVYAHWRPNAGRQREDQFSDGTLRLIALFWSLLDGDSTLLLEEPELSLNPAVVGKIPGMIGRIQARTKRQILMTTHSPELLDDTGIRLDEMIVLIPGDEGTSVATGDSMDPVREMVDSGFPAGEAVRSHAGPSNLGQLSLFAQ
jgi:predicted ATPase